MAGRYRIGDVVWARVGEILSNGAILELDSEELGFLPSAETPAGGEGGLLVGAEVLAKVIGYDPVGRPLLSLRRVSEADREEAEFHREALEFRSLLSNRVVPLAEEKEVPERVEWRLARWLAHTQGVLRRRRSRPLPTLSEEKE
ncbi:MAG: hypothetical protein ACUVQS_06445 [Candidatus Bipolaricaulaceae bacterium]